MTRFAFVLAVAALAVGTAAQAATATFDIDLYNGAGTTKYCDGMHIVINTTTGVVTGNRTGCESVALYGVLAKVADKDAVVIRDDKYAEIIVVSSKGTWIYYKTGGVTLNAGTWKKHVAGAAAAGAAGSSN